MGDRKNLNTHFQCGHPPPPPPSPTQAIAAGSGEQLLPGLIFNLNKKVLYVDPLQAPLPAAAEVVAAGHKVAAGRMESTMQNMADLLADKFDAPLSAWDRANAHLSTFYVTNLRRKVRGLAGERLGGDGGGACVWGGEEAL